MLTYLFVKNELEDSLDFLAIPLIILLDIIFILFQPILYIIYKYKELDL